MTQINSYVAGYIVQGFTSRETDEPIESMQLDDLGTAETVRREYFYKGYIYTCILVVLVTGEIALLV